MIRGRYNFSIDSLKTRNYISSLLEREGFKKTEVVEVKSKDGLLRLKDKGKVYAFYCGQLFTSEELKQEIIDESKENEARIYHFMGLADTSD